MFCESASVFVLFCFCFRAFRVTSLRSPRLFNGVYYFCNQKHEQPHPLNLKLNFRLTACSKGANYGLMSLRQKQPNTKFAVCPHALAAYVHSGPPALQVPWTSHAPPPAATPRPQLLPAGSHDLCVTEMRVVLFIRTPRNCNGGSVGRGTEIGQVQPLRY